MIPKTASHVRMRPDTAPAASCAAGAVVRFETSDDVYESLAKGRGADIPDIELEDMNVVTGPLFVQVIVTLAPAHPRRKGSSWWLRSGDTAQIGRIPPLCPCLWGAPAGWLLNLAAACALVAAAGC